MIRRFNMLDPAEIDKGITAAVNAARRGGLVVVPTEAAYALATDAFSTTGVNSLREAKNRGPEMPVPVVVGSSQTVDGIMSGITAAARSLMAAFWPGQLTLVGRSQPTLNWAIPAAGDDSVSVRMPIHPLAWKLAVQLGPTALTGANIAGADLPRTCDEAADVFDTAVAVYLDAGKVPWSQTSTTIDISVDPPVLIRSGALGVEEIRAVVPELVDPQETVATPD